MLNKTDIKIFRELKKSKNNKITLSLCYNTITHKISGKRKINSANKMIASGLLELVDVYDYIVPNLQGTGSRHFTEITYKLDNKNAK